MRCSCLRRKVISRSSVSLALAGVTVEPLHCTGGQNFWPLPLFHLIHPSVVWVKGFRIDVHTMPHSIVAEWNFLEDSYESNQSLFYFWHKLTSYRWQSVVEWYMRSKWFGVAKHKTESYYAAAFTHEAHTSMLFAFEFFCYFSMFLEAPWVRELQLFRVAWCLLNFPFHHSVR